MRDKQWAGIWQVLEDAEWLAEACGDEGSSGETLDRQWAKEFVERAREARESFLELYGSAAISADADPSDSPVAVGELADDRFSELVRSRGALPSEGQGLIALLAKVSHEIRTPLSTVVGFGELLLESELSAEQRHWVETGQRAGWQLLRLVNDLLDLIQVEAGRLSLEAIEFDLVELLEDITRGAAVRSRGKRIDVFLRTHPDVPRRVVGDPARLRQILDNLLENAIKFTERGYVLLATGTEAGGAVRFRVEDTGIGIAPDHLSSVFEPFEQEGPSIRRRYGGSGLGLAISRDLVAEMGGEITVESELGRGTTFQFTLRFDPAAAVDGTRPLDGSEIVLVNGRHTGNSGIAELLAAWGANVSLVGEREGLCARLNGGGAPLPRSIVLDASAREPGGALTVSALPKDHPARHLTVLVTALRSTLGDSSGPELDFAAQVVTPLQRRELLGALHRVQSAASTASAQPPPS